MKLLILAAFSFLLDVPSANVPVYDHDFFTYTLTIEDANPKDIDFSLQNFPEWVNLEASNKSGIISGGKNAVKLTLTLSAKKSGSINGAKIFITHNGIETKSIDLPQLVILPNAATAVPEVFLNMHHEAPYYAGTEYIFDIALNGAKEILAVHYDLSEDFLLERISVSGTSFKWIALKTGYLQLPDFTVSVKSFSDTQVSLELRGATVLVHAQPENSKLESAPISRIGKNTPENSMLENIERPLVQKHEPSQKIFFLPITVCALVIFAFFGIYCIYRKKVLSAAVFSSLFVIVFCAVFLLLSDLRLKKKRITVTHNITFYHVPDAQSSKTEVTLDTGSRIELFIEHDTGDWLYVTERKKGRSRSEKKAGWLQKEDIKPR
ncbi:MAG: hypothetical protein Ta2A_26680 [Treponemataceae bacterium]|nr:MAG: hypothetical protein Ta2A_26680 [Treponemataceae bacterium]